MNDDHQYKRLLDDEVLMKGEVRGRLATTITVLTDMLIDLNALEIYYDKPSAKSISPAVISEIRTKIASAKEMLGEALRTNE